MNDEFDFSDVATPSGAVDRNANPYATPRDLGDFDFYFEEREAEDGGPPYGRVRVKTVVWDAARLFFGKFWYFAATFLAAAAFFAAFWSPVRWATIPLPYIWFGLSVVAAPASLFGRQTALRLAKTGAIFRRDAAEPRFFSARYLGVGVLAATILFGGLLGVFLAIDLFFREFSVFELAPVGIATIFVALYGAASAAFYPFFLAEFRPGVFRSFLWSARYLRRATPIFFAFFLAAAAAFFFWGVLADFDDPASAIAATAFSAAVYVAFAAATPVAYLAATGRALYCDRARTPERADVDSREKSAD